MHFKSLKPQFNWYIQKIAIGLQHGLGVLSHIIDHLGFNNEESKLRAILLDRVD